MRTPFLLVLCVSLSLSCLAQNEDRFTIAGFDSDSDFVAFYSHFQSAVRQNDTLYISSLVTYPAKFTLASAKHLTVKDPKAFFASYSKIFDARLRNLILSSAVDSIFANANGVMLGSGQIWLAVIQTDEGNRSVIWSIDNRDIMYR